MDPLTLSLIVGLGGQLLGNLFNFFGAQQAESAARQREQKAVNAAQQYLQSLGSPGNAIQGAVKPAAAIVSGQLGAAGLTGSSIGAGALSDIASRAASQLMPAYWSAIGRGYGMMQAPYLQGMQDYMQGANQAQAGMGFDLGFLPWLLLMRGSKGGGGGGGGGLPAQLTP